MKEKTPKNIEYEVLNVANEVVFSGSGPDTLQYCKENSNIANTVHEIGNNKMSLPMGVWCWLAEKVESAIKAREDKKLKKEEQKEWRKKEKKQSKKQQIL